MQAIAEIRFGNSPPTFPLGDKGIQLRATAA